MTETLHEYNLRMAEKFGYSIYTWITFGKNCDANAVIEYTSDDARLAGHFANLYLDLQEAKERNRCREQKKLTLEMESRSTGMNEEILF